MDELKRLRNSQKGYQIHLQKLLDKATVMLEEHQTDAKESNTAMLTDIRRQLQRKDDIISKLDSQIASLISNEEELVTDVCEAEDIKESLSTAISQITELLETQSFPIQPQGPQPPVSVNSYSPSQLQDVSVPNAESNIQQPEEPGSSHSPPATQPRPVSQGVTHLPKLSIPTFSGNQLPWQSFWDCFEAAVDGNQVEPVAAAFVRPYNGRLH